MKSFYQFLYRPLTKPLGKKASNSSARFRSPPVSKARREMVYASCESDAIDKLHAKLIKGYGVDGYEILPFGMTVYHDARSANNAVPNGIFSALSPSDLQEYLSDRQQALPEPCEATRQSQFDRECANHYSAMVKRGLIDLDSSLDDSLPIDESALPVDSVRELDRQIASRVDIDRDSHNRESLAGVAR